MGQQHNAETFEAYARRRQRLSGTDIARAAFPYHETVSTLGGSDIINFSEYDYLGLRGDPRIEETAHRAIDLHGVGSHASRLVGGNLDIHDQIERDLSNFLGTEDTLMLVSGYGTNVATLSHVLMRGDMIVMDESCHNSIFTGSHASRAGFTTFRHNDLDHLAWVLANECADAARKIIAIEGLYSMDGDIPDLPKILQIARDAGAWVLVDEAHSIGVMGETGRGITEHFGIPAHDVDLIVGTLSKAFLTCGGFISARKVVVDWLRATLPGHVYSVGSPPINAAVSRRAIEILRQEPERIKRVHENALYMKREADAAGLDTGKSIGAPVVPIMFQSVEETIAASQRSLAAGCYVAPIVQIAVPTDAPRLRFFVTAKHTTGQIDRVVQALSGSNTTCQSTESVAPCADAAVPRVRDLPKPGTVRNVDDLAASTLVR